MSPSGAFVGQHGSFGKRGVTRPNTSNSPGSSLRTTQRPGAFRCRAFYFTAALGASRWLKHSDHTAGTFRGLVKIAQRTSLTRAYSYMYVVHT
jgi:hypothetical protein